MKRRLVTIFETNPQTTFSTSTLVERIYPDKYATIRDHKQNGSTKQQREAQREKARLHRNILYHLRTLEDNNTITTIRRNKNGEKIFAYHNPTQPQPANITIQPATTPTNKALDHAVDNDIITFSHTNTADPTINAVLLDAAAHTPQELHETTSSLATITDDLIAIANLANHINNHAHDAIATCLESLNTVANRTGCYICLRLTLDNTVSPSDAKTFIDACYTKTGDNIKLICRTTPTTTNTAYEALLANAQRTKSKAHIETQATSQPLFVGQRGPYTVSASTWRRITNEAFTPITCLSHSTATIDINKCLSQTPSITHLRDLLIEAAKHAYHHTITTRPDITSALHQQFGDNKDAYIDFFSTTQNYIRCWNYNADDTTPSFESFKTVMDTVGARIDELTQKQTTIFQACGLPMQTNTTIAPSFATGIPAEFTDRTYHKQTLHSLTELNDAYWTTFLNRRETTARIFRNADRTRIFHAPTAEISELITEITHLKRHHNLPLLCYDFQRLNTEQPLQQFL